jgi:putative lipase involved disintegration of autophagic bodies
MMQVENWWDRNIAEKYRSKIPRIWQCGCGCFSNNFSCQNTCQWFFLFFKNHFWHQHIKTIQNIQTILNFSKIKKIKFFENAAAAVLLVGERQNIWTVEAVTLFILQLGFFEGKRSLGSVWFRGWGIYVLL